jgi:kexin
MLFLSVSLLLATVVSRDYDNLDYFAIKYPHKNMEALSELGLKLESKIGELEHYYLVSIPKNHSHLKKRFHSPLISWFDPQTPEQRLFKRGVDRSEERANIKNNLSINDPKFDDQWHLFSPEGADHDMNVTGVWLQGVTGTGVTVALLDDGIDHENPDLKENFVLNLNSTAKIWPSLISAGKIYIRKA